jgi:hypothetical protein
MPIFIGIYCSEMCVERIGLAQAEKARLFFFFFFLKKGTFVREIGRGKDSLSDRCTESHP